MNYQQFFMLNFRPKSSLSNLSITENAYSPMQKLIPSHSFEQKDEQLKRMPSLKGSTQLKNMFKSSDCNISLSKALNKCSLQTKNLSTDNMLKGNFCCQTPQNGGLFSQKQCHQIAKNIIRSYDSNSDEVCQTLQVAKWLMDCYRAMNKKFQPTATDIASYVQVIARNGSGKVSLDDLENFIARFYFNPKK